MVASQGVTCAKIDRVEGNSKYRAENWARARAKSITIAHVENSTETRIEYKSEPSTVNCTTCFSCIEVNLFSRVSGADNKRSETIGKSATTTCKRCDDAWTHRVYGAPELCGAHMK